MYKLLSAAVAVGLLALAVPTTNADVNYADKNIDWLLESRGLTEIPEGDVVFYQGNEAVTMPIAEALEMFGERSSRVDLSAIVAGADPEANVVGAGDVWVLEDSFTQTSCPTPETVQEPAAHPFTPVDPQFWLYGGPGFYYHDWAHSDVAAVGFIGLSISWTLKTSDVHTGSESAQAGISDLFCFSASWWGTTYFPFLDGVHTTS